MPKYLTLETQISSVMESLVRAAVAEICKLIDTECVEMRLEISRGQREIETLKGKLRDRKKEFKNPSATVSLPHMVDDLNDEHERDMREHADHPVDCDEEEEDTKMNTSAPTKELQEPDNEGCGTSPLSSGSRQSQDSGFSLFDRAIQFREPHLVRVPMMTDDKVDAATLNVAAMKVEVGAHPAPPAECAYQAEQKFCTDTHGHVMGHSNNHFDNPDVSQPQTYESMLCIHKQLSEGSQNHTYDTQFSHENGPKNGEDCCVGVEFKTEQEEEPLAQKTNEWMACGMMDSDALPWPSLISMSCETRGGCSSTSQQSLHASLTDAGVHIDGTGEILPSHSIRYMGEPHPKQMRARRSHERVQGRTFKPNLAVARGSPPPAAAGRHKPFSCSLCPKSFHGAVDLIRHQRIHTGEKPFGCGVCGKRFALRGNLVTHERAHSGSRPFTCGQCGRAFAHGSNLTAHQRVHTGERPFRCPLCGKTFAWRCPFKRHLRLHCPNSPTL